MEAKLAEFVNRLQDAAGKNLRSIVLFGSAVDGDFQQEHSDLNILCLLGQSTTIELRQIHPALAWWIGEGNRAPLIFTSEELSRSAHLFSIELLDMKRRHRILFGPDWLENFEVPLQFHRLRIESDLHREQLKLRQAILAAPDKRKAHFELMLSSVSRFCTLFRHAVMAGGEPPPQTKRESVAAMARWTAADSSGFEAILDYREGKRKKRKIDIEEALHSYLEFVGLAAKEVERHFARYR